MGFYYNNKKIQTNSMKKEEIRQIRQINRQFIYIKKKNQKNLYLSIQQTKKKIY